MSIVAFDMFVALIVCSLLGLFAYIVKGLDLTGFPMALIVGYFVLIGGNSGEGLAWSWFTILIIFFIVFFRIKDIFAVNAPC